MAKFRYYIVFFVVLFISCEQDSLESKEILLYIEINSHNDIPKIIKGVPANTGYYIEIIDKFDNIKLQKGGNTNINIYFSIDVLPLDILYITCINYQDGFSSSIIIKDITGNILFEIITVNNNYNRQEWLVNLDTF